MSGPACTVGRVRNLVSDLLDQPSPGGGGYFLNVSDRWGTAGLFYGSENPEVTYAVLNLPAGALREIGHDRALQLLVQLLRLGWRATRLDVALDFLDRTGADLIEAMYAGCEAGQLCGARTHQRIYEVGQQGPTGHALNIGKRGKHGSGRYLRVYDKGLEQRTAELGEWVRAEVELSDACAADAAVAIAEADDPRSVMLGLVLGCVDFREVTGSARLADRPRAQWWADVVQGVDLLRPVAVRARTTVEGYMRWIRTAVAPKVATIAACTGLTVANVVGAMAGEVRASAEHLNDPVVRSVLTEFGMSVESARMCMERWGGYPPVVPPPEIGTVT